jgi:hypothetical protein
MALVERPRAQVCLGHEHHHVTAARRAGVPLAASKEQRTEPTRLM